MKCPSMMRLLTLCCALAACTDGSSTQVLTGRVDTSKGALAIRAIADDNVVTATPVRSDGSFTLSLPSGSNYRLEVLTRTGVKNVVARSGNVLRDLTFKVCDPGNPFDVGGMGDPNPDGICGPNDLNCVPCDPANGMDCSDPCKANPMDPGCLPPPDPCSDPTSPNCWPCDPMDLNCQPPKCEDPNDPTCCVLSPDGTCCPPDDPMCAPSCQPGDPMCCDANGTCTPPCDPMTDPNCECKADGTCQPPPTCDVNDPTCMGCYPDGTCGCTDPTAPGCVPPCMDPMDPNTCKDPCVEDPIACGCTTPDCWPAPEPCCDPNGMCDPSDGMEPDNIPGDFGCQ
jgi:hypothetical protein